ncbi:MAG TPA: hypothetical protein VF234_10985, partial [Limnochordia bacterium]
MKASKMHGLSKLFGLRVFKKGEYIERAAVRGHEVFLLACGDDTEVWRHTLKAGARFNIYPAEDWDGLECFYILAGTLRWESPEGPRQLTAGDFVSARYLSEPGLFHADSDVELLYVTSRPGFEAMS